MDDCQVDAFIQLRGSSCSDVRVAGRKQLRLCLAKSGGSGLAVEHRVEKGCKIIDGEQAM
eukprot:2097838-Amphidinium_carterae.1